MDTNMIAMTGVLVIFNGATIKLLTVVMSSVSVKDAVTEKSTTDSVQAAGMAIGQGDTAPTSYSRVAGMIGATVMATFFWALGNTILYKSFISPHEIGELISSISSYFLAGGSLFLPYAFNQLKSAFAPKA